MSYNCCSGNFSSRFLRGYLRSQSPRSSCGSSYPSNLVCSPSTCQLASSLYRGCQETYCEPTSCQTSCVVSSPCQTSCYRPGTSTPCSPCRSAYTVSLGSRSSSSCSLGCGSRIFRPLGYGVCGFSSLGYGSRFCHPTYLASRSYQTSCYQPTCSPGFHYRSIC
ncbi:LOW QUALITY PROTEIN: keratin-associated protein 13-1-like [Pteropus alecto]|uniref:LOW QUALITY PROTEIN: keratin-associated protein 13-1-like n=1 Tax=Pteropus alecto TaxID=9402 RepID=UPI000D538A14|nr:LOW QUALITY PROTEIN: keratin-associated protein 13-1-like [Pteropus alecto]